MIWSVKYKWWCCCESGGRVNAVQISIKRKFVRNFGSKLNFSWKEILVEKFSVKWILMKNFYSFSQARRWISYWFYRLLYLQRSPIRSLRSGHGQRLWKTEQLTVARTFITKASSTMKSPDGSESRHLITIIEGDVEVRVRNSHFWLRWKFNCDSHLNPFPLVKMFSYANDPMRRLCFYTHFTLNQFQNSLWSMLWTSSPSWEN